MIDDWKEIPWPDYESFGIKNIRDDVKFVYYIDTGRGCPGVCTFCKNGGGVKYRERPVEDIIAEIEHAKHILRPEPKSMRFEFCDDVLGISKQSLKTICMALKKLNVRNWTAYLRVSFVDEEVAEILQGAGCSRVFLGVESGTDKILRSMRKGITVAQIEKAFEDIGKVGIHVSGNLLFGDPEETYEDAMETLDFYYRWRDHPKYPVILKPVMLKLFPGSLIYKKAIAEGKIYDPVEYIRGKFRLINISKMSDVEFKKVRSIVGGLYDTFWADNLFNRAFKSGDNPRLNIMYDFSDRIATIQVLRCNCGNSFSRQIPFTEMRSDNSSYSCPTCKTLIWLFDPRAATGHKNTIARNINALLARYGKIAFWGCGFVFRNFLRPEMIANDAVFLVDKTATRIYSGKPVFTPAVIADEAIHCVINCTYPLSPVHEDINNELATEYPGVTRVEHLYAVQDYNFRA